jgi:hypothetical protein
VDNEAVDFSGHAASLPRVREGAKIKRFTFLKYFGERFVECLHALHRI